MVVVKAVAREVVIGRVRLKLLAETAIEKNGKERRFHARTLIGRASSHNSNDTEDKEERTEEEALAHSGRMACLGPLGINRLLAKKHGGMVRRATRKKKEK